MTAFEPRFAGYAQRVRDSFDRQPAMATLGVSITDLAPGRITLEMPFHVDFTQQHGFVHTGIVTTALDSACGYAAFSLMAEDAAVLTVELKTSLMAPADGDHFLFRAEVLKPGRTLSFAEATAFALKDGAERPVARMTATLMAVTGRADIRG
ncbi:PaaI family thioesterase [Actibacterium ureilyticum]|uniref:PaaI family thioesterase n=1 Tax=Actibacterium ureilyticum TaxID=1590614 RepID=UPI000BAAE478|nr:PaaI family thioesterase [Actibacterium ureilyticum]